MNLIKRLLAIWLRRHCEWGFDDSGDATLRVFFIHFAVHREGIPTVTFFASAGFTATGETHSELLLHMPTKITEFGLWQLKHERHKILHDKAKQEGRELTS